MTPVQQAQQVCLLLESLLPEIRKAANELPSKAATPNVADPAHANYFQRLHALESKVKQARDVFRRLLASVSAQRNLPAGGRGDEARHLAFRANQSLNDQAAAIERAQERARSVSKELDDLLSRAKSLRPGDIDRAIDKLGKGTVDFFKKQLEAEKQISDALAERLIDTGEAQAFKSAILEARKDIPGGRAPMAADYLALASLSLVMVRLAVLKFLRKK